MAPYVMKIECINQSNLSVDWVGSSTMSSLDGKTDVKGDSIPPGSTGWAVITKSGGIHGLFTSVSWKVGKDYVDPKARFCVHSQMSTDPGAVVTIRLRNLLGYSDDDFKVEAWKMADSHYRIVDQPKFWQNPIQCNGFTIDLEAVDCTYPNSHCRVRVSGYVAPPESQKDIMKRLAEEHSKKIREENRKQQMNGQY